MSEAGEDPDSPPICLTPNVLLFLCGADEGEVGVVIQPHLAP